MTTPADIAVKQIKVHGANCVCDFCVVAQELIQTRGAPAPKISTAERDSVIQKLNDQIGVLKKEVATFQDLYHNAKSAAQLYENDLKLAKIKHTAEISDLTKRLVEANFQLQRLEKGSAEEYIKKMKYYKETAEEWRRKTIALDEEIKQYDPNARWDNPFYDPDHVWQKKKDKNPP